MARVGNQQGGATAASKALYKDYNIMVMKNKKLSLFDLLLKVSVNSHDHFIFFSWARPVLK